MTDRIFVSYSHDDASLVMPVVRLLRSTNDFVFLDADSIKPGGRWRAALIDAIRGANLVVIFWCRHSSESPEVEREYRSAIEAQKDVIPVLLDSTPVPPVLGEFQWIDFRELGREKHARLEPGSIPSPLPAARSVVVWRGALAAVAALLVAAAAFSVLMLRGAAPTVPTGTQPLPEPPPSTNIVGWLLVLAAVVLGSIALIVLRRRRTRIESGALAGPAPAATGQDKAMADTLEGELRRRLRR